MHQGGFDAVPGFLETDRGVFADHGSGATLGPGEPGEAFDEVHLAPVDARAVARGMAGRIIAAHAGPFEHDVVDPGSGLVQPVERQVGQFAHHPLEFGIGAHRQVQRGQIAIAARQGQEDGFEVDLDVRAIDLAVGAQLPGVGVVVQKMHVGDFTVDGDAVLQPGERGGAGDVVLVGPAGVVVVVGGDGLDVEARQGLEFAVLGDAVLVGVLPDAQSRKGGIIGVDAVVVVGVEQTQLLEGGHLVIAIQFGDVVDAAVAIDVHGQQAIVGIDPADPFGKAVGVDVEEHPAAVVGVGEVGGNAVAVEVEDQGAEVVFGAAHVENRLADDRGRAVGGSGRGECAVAGRVPAAAVGEVQVGPVVVPDVLGAADVDLQVVEAGVLRAGGGKAVCHELEAVGQAQLFEAGGDFLLGV